MLSPFECLCGNFILPEPASYVFFYALSNLRNLLYIIGSFGLIQPETEFSVNFSNMKSVKVFYANDFSESRLHHEIYLSDARKVAPNKWRTVIRHPIKRYNKFVELAAITDCFSTSEFLKYPPELFVSQKHFSKKHREILSEEQ